MIKIQDKINIEISKQVKKLREEVIELRALLSSHETTIREYMIMSEEEDRIIESMIDKARGK
tara:strand:- start:30132 stop:30317 length:186 start_codon:yes stop_codon:yes gene_type:complete